MEGGSAESPSHIVRIFSIQNSDPKRPTRLCAMKGERCDTMITASSAAVSNGRRISRIAVPHRADLQHPKLRSETHHAFMRDEGRAVRHDDYRQQRGREQWKEDQQNRRPTSCGSSASKTPIRNAPRVYAR